MTIFYILGYLGCVALTFLLLCLDWLEEFGEIALGTAAAALFISLTGPIGLAAGLLLWGHRLVKKIPNPLSGKRINWDRVIYKSKGE